MDHQARIRRPPPHTWTTPGACPCPSKGCALWRGRGGPGGLFPATLCVCLQGGQTGVLIDAFPGDEAPCRRCQLRKHCPRHGGASTEDGDGYLAVPSPKVGLNRGGATASCNRPLSSVPHGSGHCWVRAAICRPDERAQGDSRLAQLGQHSAVFAALPGEGRLCRAATGGCPVGGRHHNVESRTAPESSSVGESISQSREVIGEPPGLRGGSRNPRAASHP